MDNMSEMVSILTNVRTVSGMNTSTNINYGGVSGSILDVYGPGEYEWDKFTVKFHSHRGRDDSVMIRWGKNMTDVKKTTDSGNIWTGVLPFWSDMDEAQEPVLLMLPERVVYSDAADDFVYKMVIPLDLSSSFENQPTEEQLRNAAQRYVRNNAHTGIPTSIEVSIAYYSLIFQQPLSTQGQFRWCNCHPTIRFLLSLLIQEVRMKYRPLFVRYI